MPLARMVAPCNAPDYSRQRPTMDGFVADYISTFTAEMRRQPTYEEYSQIMTGYTLDQMPVTIRETAFSLFPGLQTKI
jgi:phospholipase C